MAGLKDMTLGKIIFGDENPRENPIVKGLGQLIFGKESSKDNTVHMRMFGGKEVTVSPIQNGAFLNIPKAYGDNLWGVGMSQREYDKFLALDESHKKQFIEKIVKEQNPELYNQLKKNEMNDLSLRGATKSPYTSDGTPIRYPSEHPEAGDFLANKASMMFDELDSQNWGQEESRSMGLGR